MPADTFRARIGSQSLDLPIVPIDPDVSIALLMTIDAGLSFIRTAGTELGALLAPLRPECVVSAATLGIPVAMEVSRALGLDDYLILQKTPKLHLADGLREPLTSITSAGRQELILDRRRLRLVAGRRVVFVDDVISTGSSVAAALRLLDAAGADLVGIGALLTEGEGWRSALGERAGLVAALGSIPVLRRAQG